MTAVVNVVLIVFSKIFLFCVVKPGSFWCYVTSRKCNNLFTYLLHLLR